MKIKLLALSLFLSIFYFHPIPNGMITTDYPLDNPYYVPDRPVDTRARVEIVIQDDLNDENVDSIQEVYFNNEKLNLRKTDFLGNRGRFYLRISPGTYEVKWTIRSKTDWPTVETYRENVTVPRNAKLFYIQINQASIQTDTIQ